MTEPPREVAIVGSGPAGYTAAISTARAGSAPVVVAASVGRDGAFPSTAEVENHPFFGNGIQGPAGCVAALDSQRCLPALDDAALDDAGLSSP